MTNKEKYGKEILDIACTGDRVAMRKSDNVIVGCRKLECWRLQGYSDDDYYRALSVNPGKQKCLNGSLYKQAGNSIPVPIFESLFRKIILGETAEVNTDVEIKSEQTGQLRFA